MPGDDAPAARMLVLPIAGNTQRGGEDQPPGSLKAEHGR